MSWAQPTAQYGHTPGTALASLIRNDVAAASTGLRSIPPDATAVEAAAMPYLKKSRRDRLIATLLYAERIGRACSDGVTGSPLDLGARQLIPRPAEHDDPFGTPVRWLDLDDVSGVQRGETRLGVLVRDDEGLRRAGELGTHVGLTPDAQATLGMLHVDDHEARGTDVVGETLRHRLNLLESRESGASIAGILDTDLTIVKTRRVKGYGWHRIGTTNPPTLGDHPPQ